MTEAEAKTRWCPFARDSETAGNRSQHETATQSAARFPCIASACLAWRVDNPGRSIAVFHGPAPGGAMTYEDVPPSGFCGLAGAPQ